MNKRMLEAPTLLYVKWPIWVLVPVALAMVEVFFFLGSTLYYILFGIVAGIYVGITQNVSLFTTGGIPLHVELLAFLAVSLLLFAWVKWAEKRPIVSLGFFKENWFKELSLGFLIGGLMFSLSLLFVYLFGGVKLAGVDFSAGTIGFVMSIIPFWLIQGGTEELLTRGWLLPILNKRTNLAWAIGLSSSLFGVMHLGNDNVTVLSIVSIILSGVTMALYMLKRDNIWGVVGLHAAWNFFQGNIYGVSVSGSEAGNSLLHFATQTGVPDWLSGGQFGIEGSLFASLVELAFIAYFAYGLMAERKK
ncbi:CPBP family intramembrane glutamic endopeptidase [Streptococcus caprae]|uniref:CPBP family intramembrane glutamic endopeptidase n=1 Tax=Streptococcus caprae TaxID=1640501 RepID=A0ABV8CUP4_9STRE